MFDASDPQVEALLAPLREVPAQSAILTDVDGTLAPIVERSADAVVPEPTRRALERISEQFGLVGCVSGRTAIEVREMVGLDGLTYSGNHGFEILAPGSDQPRYAPGVEDGAAAVSKFVDGLERSRLEAAGLRLEDKGAIQALHWRGCGDADQAEALAAEIRVQAESSGLGVHQGRMVLELRPPLDLSKQSAIVDLVRSHPQLESGSVLFAGDDMTDMDGFRGLRQLVGDGVIAHAVCVGIDSAEAPAGLARDSDLVLAGPGEFVGLLESLVP